MTITQTAIATGQNVALAILFIVLVLSVIAVLVIAMVVQRYRAKKWWDRFCLAMTTLQDIARGGEVDPRQRAMSVLRFIDR